MVRVVVVMIEGDSSKGRTNISITHPERAGKSDSVSLVLMKYVFIETQTSVRPQHFYNNKDMSLLQQPTAASVHEVVKTP